MQNFPLFNRDVSWLSFNYRVLEEAKDFSLPLYERIKFLAIYSNNLDEFFRVRVGSIRHDLNNTIEHAEIENLLKEINQIVSKQQQEFGFIFREQIIPELEKNKIHLIRNDSFSKSQIEFIKQYYLEELIYQIQPILLVKNKFVPFLQNGAIYLLVGLSSKVKSKAIEGEKKKPTKRIKHAIIKIPSDTSNRFVELPSYDDKSFICFLDDIIRLNLKDIFKGYKIEFAHSIKVSRDADLHIEDEFEGDLIEKLKKSLNKRKVGAPSRFLYDENMPEDAVDFLHDIFKIKKSDMIKGGKYHNFFDFFKFPNPLSPNLESFAPIPTRIPSFDTYSSVFEAIKNKDWMLHFPYQSYDYVLRFLNEAAYDPKVTEIKATQYRVASNSGIVSALMNAAQNGKKVTVFVEVKARFDEELNLRFAQQMASAGVNVIYSMPGLKVHAKAILVTRESGNRRGVRQYAFLSTGNFNENTAKIYSDHGFFTSEYAICDELTDFFQILENQQKDVEFNHLLVAQYNMVSKLNAYIDEEIQQAKLGNKAYIILKVNNLEDEGMIQKLYYASQCGVKIDIIVRSICCLIPNMPFSSNITVRRIVDQFLEHARVIYFYNSGKEKVYLSSADWMKRNLHHRIELGFPIENEELKKEVLDIIHYQLNDNMKSRILDENLNNNPIPKKSFTSHRAQNEIYQMLKNKYFRVFRDDDTER